MRGETNTERVYVAIVDIYRTENKEVSRQEISERLGMPLPAVSNAMKTLIEVQQRVILCGRGRYKPATVFREDEAVSWTALPDGTFKLEKGDQVMDFTPREYTWLFPSTRQPTAEHDASDMVTTLLKQTRVHLRKLEAELAELKKANAPQRSLELG